MTNKKSIYKQILQSQIFIIIIFAVITALVFNITLNIYINTQTKNELISTSESLKKTFKLNSQDKDDNNETEFIIPNNIFKKHKLFLDVNFAVVNKNNDIIYPKKNDDKNYDLAEKLISSVDYKKSSKKNQVINVNVSNSKFTYLSTKFEFLDDNKEKYLVLYADLNERESIVRTLNLLVIGIILISTIISLIISRITSKKLSMPIYKLIDISKEISNKNYPRDFVDFNNKEINDLGISMINMSKTIYNNENAMKVFVENSSHELRTPLMSIQGYAEAIKYKVIDDTEGAIDIIIKESARMTKIVEDLLYLSKLDSMDKIIELESINVNLLIRSVIERISGIAIKENKKIIYKNNNEDLYVYGSEEKLSRCLLNLVGNSLRHANSEVFICFVKEDNTVILTIEDDGLGFGENELDKVFNRFYVGKEGNYGLGLTIAKTIITKHGGSIIANNRLEGGAKITVILECI